MLIRFFIVTMLSNALSKEEKKEMKKMEKMLFVLLHPSFLLDLLSLCSMLQAPLLNGQFTTSQRSNPVCTPVHTGIIHFRAQNGHMNYSFWLFVVNGGWTMLHFPESQFTVLYRLPKGSAFTSLKMTKKKTILIFFYSLWFVLQIHFKSDKESVYLTF